MKRALWFPVVLAAALVPAWSGESPDLAKELADMKAEMERLRQMITTGAGQTKPLERFAPNSPAKTKMGELTISGLLHGWLYHIGDDKYGFFGNYNATAPGNEYTATAGHGDIVRSRSMDGFRIRRFDLVFSLDLNQYFGAKLGLDLARETSDVPALPTNLTTRIAAVNVGTGAATLPLRGTDPYLTGSRNGSTSNRIFEDAFVILRAPAIHLGENSQLKIAGQFGQMRPKMGFSGPLSSGLQDFVERPIIGQLVDRDIGAQVKIAYNQSAQNPKGEKQDWELAALWLGAFNGGGYISAPTAAGQNRADENEDLDMLAAFNLQPLHPAWDAGTLDLGASFMIGHHGSPLRESSQAGINPSTGLSEAVSFGGTTAWRFQPYLTYEMGGPVKGLWVKGEGALFHERPNNVATFNYAIAGQRFGKQPYSGVMATPETTMVMGAAASLGFRLGDGAISGLPDALKPLELCVRYEYFENLLAAKPVPTVLVAPGTNYGNLDNSNKQVETFGSHILTFGLNYRFLKDNAKLQLNYNLVREPTLDKNRLCREVDNDSAVLSLQIGF